MTSSGDDGHRPPPCDHANTRRPAPRPPPRAGRAGARGGSVPTSASGRTWATRPGRWQPGSTPWRRYPVHASPASRGSTRRRPSASSTSPSSATPSWRSTSRPARIPRRRRSRSSSRSRAWSERSAAGTARAGGLASSTSTCSSSAATRCESSDPPAARSDDPARSDRGWLQVPHAGARERLFVLAPLADLAAGLRPPGWRETVASARARAEIAEGPGAARPVAAWDRRIGAWRAA